MKNAMRHAGIQAIGLREQSQNLFAIQTNAQSSIGKPLQRLAFGPLHPYPIYLRRMRQNFDIDSHII